MAVWTLSANDLNSKLTLNPNEVLNWVERIPCDVVAPDLAAFVPSFVRKVRVEELCHTSPTRLVKKHLLHLERQQCGLQTDPLYVVEYTRGLRGVRVTRVMDPALCQVYNHEQARKRPGCIDGVPVHIGVASMHSRFGEGLDHSKPFQTFLTEKIDENLDTFLANGDRMEDPAIVCQVVSKDDNEKDLTDVDGIAGQKQAARELDQNVSKPTVRFTRRHAFCEPSEWMYHIPDPVQGGSVPSPLFIRKDLNRSHRMPVILSSWVMPARAHAEPAVNQTLRYRTAPSADMSWRKKGTAPVSAAEEAPNGKGDEKCGDDLKQSADTNLSVAKNESARPAKSFTTLSSTVDFDPFGALPGDKEKKKPRKKKEQVFKSLTLSTASKVPNRAAANAFKPDRPVPIREDVEFEFNKSSNPSNNAEAASNFTQMPLLNRGAALRTHAPPIQSMGRVALAPTKPVQVRKGRFRSAFDPAFLRSTDSVAENDEDDENSSDLDYMLHSRSQFLMGSRFYCGRMSAPRVTVEGSYPMVGAANHLYGMPEDLPTELNCVTCDCLPTLSESQLERDVSNLAKQLKLVGDLSPDEQDYLGKMVRLDRAIKIRTMNKMPSNIFSGEQLDMINRRFLEALHNYYMAMDMNLGRQQPGLPWVHSAYTEHMNFLNAGIKAMEFSPLNPSRGGCLGKPSAADGGHSAGKCALDKNNFYMYSPGTEIFSRKVFVGGVPSDIDEESLLSAFRHFGKLSADWPNRSEFRNNQMGNRSLVNPNGSNSKSRSGYVFIVYEKEQSVHALRDACIVEDDQFFMEVLNVQQQPKLVQVRPWMLAEADYVVQPFMHINLRSAIFIGGVPRPIRAVELAHMIDELYGNVVMAGIDTDLPLKYPKGAGRVVFSDFHSYMRAITDKYVRLQHGDIDKVVEIKPYVLDDQPCDECRGQLTDEKAAPFFCPHPDCLQYYCENCWGLLHRSDHRTHHRPLIKEA